MFLESDVLGRKEKTKRQKETKVKSDEKQQSEWE